MARTGVNPVFLDTNILVHANVAESPRHGVALETVEQLSEAGVEMWISRQVLREFLAVLTRPQVFLKPRPISTITATVRQFETLFRIAEENATVTARLLDLLERTPVGGRQVHDANIVATMLSHGVTRLVTENTTDFKRFADLITVLPLGAVDQPV
jgi:predicted nucleic acid-binding protein